MTDYLDKYNPSVEIFEHYQVQKYADKEDRAFNYWQNLVKAKRSQEGLFLVIGKLLRDIRDEKMYEVLDYETFTEFLNSSEVSFSRESAYLYIRTYEYYIEYLELNPESVSKLSVGRLAMMIPALKKIGDKSEITEQIEKYSEMRHSEFVREIKNTTRKDNRPSVYFSKEVDKWIVSYYDDSTVLQSLGNYEEETTEW